MAWLPVGFEAPARLEMSTGHHLRGIQPADVEIDYAAVMGSRARLWEIFGRAWGWPPATMTREQDLEDLVRHADEMSANASFNYAIFDRDEAALFGCLYIDPPEKVGADADISWWVIDAEVGGELERALRTEIPRWITASWPFASPRFIGEDLTWDEYLALPGVE